MEAIKKIVNILVMVYLVAAALIYLNILNVGQSNPGFYTTFFMVGGAILLLELIVENLYILTLKRGSVQTQHKINELKANLYDHKQELQDLKIKQAEVPLSPPVTVVPAPEPTVPPVITTYDNPAPDRVIITPSPTPGITEPERRLSQNTDSDL